MTPRQRNPIGDCAKSSKQIAWEIRRASCLYFALAYPLLISRRGFLFYQKREVSQKGVMLHDRISESKKGL